MTIFSRITRKIAAHRAKGIAIPELTASPIEGLPTELWYHILEIYIGTDMLDPNSHLFGKFPASLCRVNKRFNQFFTPMLYYRFDYDFFLPRLDTLYLFLRTIVSRPDLAQRIREVTITTARISEGCEPAKLHSKLLKLYKDNKPILTKAAEQA